jgi:surface-anchored protein
MNPGFDISALRDFRFCLKGMFTLFSPFGKKPADNRYRRGCCFHSSRAHFQMKSFIFILLAAVSAFSAEPVRLETEHADFRILYDPSAVEFPLSVVMNAHDHGRTYATNEAVLVAREASRIPLPPGTPFGNEGESLWILPQSQDPELLYLGFSAEGLPRDVFSGPLDFILKSVEGPGHFFAWQASQFGGLDVKMNSRDGVTDDDKTSPFIGSHEHFNWGFTTNGVYNATFQIVGRRVGEETNIFSPLTTFTFLVLPLPENPETPFQKWQRERFDENAPDTIKGADADPDMDEVPNVVEYALNLDPHMKSVLTYPLVSIVALDSVEYPAITFERVKSAQDIEYSVVGAGTVTASTWEPIAAVHEVDDRGTTEIVTLRDSQPMRTSQRGFYQLLIRQRATTP